MFISSDTNIWIDFDEINHTEHPFLLKHEYYISSASFEDELIQSDELKAALLAHGLRLTELTDEEFTLASHYRTLYRRLSLYDTFALSIAKCRSWILLTGDRPLRLAAESENVEVHGVIWIYDELLRQDRISSDEYHDEMFELRDAVREGRCRLPLAELEKRIKE